VCTVLGNIRIEYYPPVHIFGPWKTI